MEKDEEFLQLAIEYVVSGKIQVLLISRIKVITSPRKFDHVVAPLTTADTITIEDSRMASRFQ